MREVTRLFRPPRRSRLIAGLVIAVLAGIVGWWAGMDAPHAAALALAVATVAACWVAAPEHEVPEWQPEELAAAEGTRHDVVRLSWMLRSRRGTIQAAGVRRLRELAQERLDPFRLGLDDAADRTRIEALIGGEAYATLHPRSDRLPRLAAVSRCLDRLDTLHRADAATTIEQGGTR
jgi:hypothetical protein